MDTFSPEFTAYWLAEPGVTVEHQAGGPSHESTLTTTQQVALEELAERICAARRVA
jgi:hypothetical protein